MLRNVFGKTLYDRRRAMLWWGLGVLATAILIIWFYPTIKDSLGLTRYIEQLPPALRATFMGEFTDISSAEGYLNIELFAMMLPLLFMILTIALGAAAIAGEEERGTLELLLCNPLPRWRVVVEKFAALVMETGLLSFVLWIGLAIGARLVGMDISWSRLAEATLSNALLALAVGALALAVGAASGKSGTSMGVASVVALAAYLLNSLAPIVEALKPYRKFSLFYLYIGADPLKNGLNLGHAAVLAAVTLLLLGLSLVAFERRDISV